MHFGSISIYVYCDKADKFPEVYQPDFDGYDISNIFRGESEGGRGGGRGEGSGLLSLLHSREREREREERRE